jgi:hypothetical protein
MESEGRKKAARVAERRRFDDEEIIVDEYHTGEQNKRAYG